MDQKRELNSVQAKVENENQFYNSFHDALRKSSMNLKGKQPQKQTPMKNSVKKFHAGDAIKSKYGPGVNFLSVIAIL